MIQLTKRGILAKKLLHGVRITYALCGFDVWYENNSKTSTVALITSVLLSVLHALLMIMSWTGIMSNDSGITHQFKLAGGNNFSFWVSWIVQIITFVTYTVFRFTQFKNWIVCGNELRRIDKNFQKFGIDTRTVGHDFCLFIILFLAIVISVLKGLLDYTIWHSKVPILKIYLGLYSHTTNCFIDFIIIGGFYLLYLRYEAVNKECSLLKDLSDSIRYQIAIVKFVREQHQELALLTQRIVNTCKLPLILSIVRAIVVSILRMYSVFSLPPGLTERDITWYSYTTMIFIILQIFRVFMMCNICTMMTSEANRTNTVLSDAETNNPYLYMRHERANLALYLKQQNVTIRPFNMCEIDNGLFLSIIGTILVYLFYFVDTSKVQQ